MLRNNPFLIRLPELGLVAFIAFALLAASAHAQQRPGTDTGNLGSHERVAPIPQVIDDRPRADWSPGTSWGTRVGRTDEDPRSALPPFGAHLFQGGFRATRSEGMNADYRVVPGDQINLRVWGAVEMEQVLTVDAQGNVFIPGVGPVAVQGTSAGEIDNRITAAVQSVYPDNVNVYTNLQGIQPVAVYVTGYVNKPGRYAGVPTDSLLYFVAQADGIDPVMGSYREIDILREGETIQTADLYKFLLNGEMPRPQFQDGDTVIVREKGPSVAVTGTVERPSYFELKADAPRGSDLLRVMRERADVSHVLLRGHRSREPVSHYLPVATFAETRLHDGDDLVFSSDQREEHIVVQFEGSFHGPSRFVLPRDARLHDLLDAVAVPEALTDTESVSIRRESVAERQRIALEQSLQRLESAYLGASSATAEEAEIRVKEAELIAEFVQRAREVEPSGHLVVAHEGEISNVRLRDGDVITVPENSDSILISGEVVMPQSLVFRSDRSVADYIRSSGGFSSRADEDLILVVRPNGEVLSADSVRLRAGDEILVLPEVPTKNLQLASTLTQILYQIAVSAKIALDI